MRLSGRPEGPCRRLRPPSPPSTSLVARWPAAPARAVEGVDPCGPANTTPSGRSVGAPQDVPNYNNVIHIALLTGCGWSGRTVDTAGTSRTEQQDGGDHSLWTKAGGNPTGGGRSSRAGCSTGLKVTRIATESRARRGVSGWADGRVAASRWAWREGGCEGLSARRCQGASGRGPGSTRRPRRWAGSGGTRPPAAPAHSADQLPAPRRPPRGRAPVRSRARARRPEPGPQSVRVRRSAPRRETGTAPRPGRVR